MKGKKLWVTSNIPVLHTGIWPSPEDVKRISCLVLCKIYLPVLPLMFRNWSQSGRRVAMTIPANCPSCWLFCWLILFSLPVGSVNGVFLASVGLAIVIICIILRPGIEWIYLWHFLILFHETRLENSQGKYLSPVNCVPVLLVVVLLLVAAVAVQLLLLLRIKPPMRWQRAVSALLGFELLQFGDCEYSWNARKEWRELAQNSKESTGPLRASSQYYLNCLVKRP